MVVDRVVPPCCLRHKATLLPKREGDRRGCVIGAYRPAAPLPPLGDATPRRRDDRVSSRSRSSGASGGKGYHPHRQEAGPDPAKDRGKDPRVGNPRLGEHSSEREPEPEGAETPDGKTEQLRQHQPLLCALGDDTVSSARHGVAAHAPKPHGGQSATDSIRRDTLGSSRARARPTRGETAFPGSGVTRVDSSRTTRDPPNGPMKTTATSASRLRRSVKRVPTGLSVLFTALTLLL